MTIRLSIISFAGIVRTLVAVGTERLASMFVASDLAMPRSGATVFTGSGVGCSAVDSARAGSFFFFGASAGIGFLAGSTEVVRAATDFLAGAPSLGAWSGAGAGAAAGVAASVCGGAVVGATISRLTVAPVIALAAVVVAVSAAIFLFGPPQAADD